MCAHMTVQKANSQLLLVFSLHTLGLLHLSKLLNVGDFPASPSPQTGSSQESESHVNVMAMSYVRRTARCVRCCKPTFCMGSASCVSVCLSVSVHVFKGEGFSEDPYPGRLMLQADEHICLSRPYWSLLCDCV